MNNLPPIHFESAIARHVSEDMLSRLDFVKIQPKIVADLSATQTVHLKKRYPQSAIIKALEDQAVDMIFSNLSLSWCADLTKKFQEWRYSLRPEGLLILTMLGLDTLQECRDLKLIPALHDMHNIGDLLTQAGWSDPVLDVERVEVKYQDSQKLLKDLQLSGMIAQEQVDLQVESVTYEIIHALAWNPDLSNTYSADETGEVRIPLSHLRRK
jgi:SAM-dependent methyltransferase